jgi:membrane protein DedA with SNARE-associated domain
VAGALRMSIVRYLGAAAAGKVIKNIIVASGASTVGGLVASIASST